MKDKSPQAEHSLDATDLLLILTIVRAGTLAAAGKRMGVDQSTIFRALQRLEKRLGISLFDRLRTGSKPTEAAVVLAQHAERIEAEIEGARISAGSADGPAQGLVRISTTDVLLSGIVIPSLSELILREPLLAFETTVSYQLANLSKRDADIALRVTTKPPENMVGRSLGAVKEAVFGSKEGQKQIKPLGLLKSNWIDLDDTVPNYLASKWRNRVAPESRVVLRASSIQTVFDSVVKGVGVAVLPVFMTRGRKDLVRLSENIQECEAQLWLLAHPGSRHLKRVSTVFRHMADTISLD